MKLGVNFEVNKPFEEVYKEIEDFSQISTEAIEISLTKLKGILEFPFEKLYPILTKFKYKSLHLPVITGEDSIIKEFLKYPDTNIEVQLKIIKKIAKDLDINSYVLHPDQVTDFDWANEQFGSLLGFENIDSNKSFGKSIEDMQFVFEKSPQAKWIFDVNHLYTNDATMKSAKTFYEKFKSRLTHYHISAFGGFHSSFIKNPNESIILSGVFDTSIPMIHEGYNPDDNNLREEYNFIEKHLFNII